MTLLKEWGEKIDDLSLRERGAVFFCTLVVIYFLWDLFLMQPLQIAEKRTNSQLQQKQAEQFALNAELLQLNVNKQSDPNKADKEKLQSLKRQLAETEVEVEESTQHLISPKQMAVMLEAVLLKVKGLELLEIKGLGSSPIVEVKAPAGGEANNEQADVEAQTVSASVVKNAYKHGLRIVFQGDYMSTLEYIQELEGLGWGFFWESLDLEVKEYPDSIVSITVYTLSLNKNWIGV